MQKSVCAYMRGERVCVLRGSRHSTDSGSIDYRRLKLRLGALIDFCMAISRACSLVILEAWIAGRCSLREVRGVWAGVVAAEAVLFLLDLKRDMVEKMCWFLRESVRT